MLGLQASATTPGTCIWLQITAFGRQCLFMCWKQEKKKKNPAPKKESTCLLRRTTGVDAPPASDPRHLSTSTPSRHRQWLRRGLRRPRLRLHRGRRMHRRQSLGARPVCRHPPHHPLETRGEAGVEVAPVDPVGTSPTRGGAGDRLRHQSLRSRATQHTNRTTTK